MKKYLDDIITDAIPDNLAVPINKSKELLSSLGNHISEIHKSKEFEKYGTSPDPQDIIGFAFSTEDMGASVQSTTTC